MREGEAIDLTRELAVQQIVWQVEAREGLAHAIIVVRDVDIDVEVSKATVQKATISRLLLELSDEE